MKRSMPIRTFLALGADTVAGLRRWMGMGLRWGRGPKVRGLLQARVRAATMVEVLVSMSLVSIVFGIGAMVWLQVAGRGAAYRLAEQELHCRNLLDEVDSRTELTDRVFVIDNLQYSRSAKPISAVNGLYEVRILALGAKGEPLFQRCRILHLP